ncbi:hypothetical protein LZ30DRAFT_700742 [Colletotrichum cereale]|nr:hypothetical protein LZ30DRAFT_700742 [Colletotrichum cereale]
MQRQGLASASFIPDSRETVGPGYYCPSCRFQKLMLERFVKRASFFYQQADPSSISSSHIAAGASPAPGTVVGAAKVTDERRKPEQNKSTMLLLESTPHCRYSADQATCHPPPPSCFALASAELGLLRKTAVPTYWLPAQHCHAIGSNIRSTKYCCTLDNLKEAYAWNSTQAIPP